MSGGYRTPQDDAIDILTGRLSDLAGQVRELARPSGTQTADAVKTLMQLVNDLPAQIYAVLAAAVNTGTVNATGDVNAGGRLIGATGVRSPGARANVLTTWIAAQIDPAGNLGIVSSSVDVKRDFEPVDMSGEVAAIFSAALIQFRYIEHVAEYGDDAPVMLGSLAQYFESIGLGRYVTRNVEGEIDGIQYAELVKPLIATVQNLNQRLLAQDARLAALEAAQPTQTA